MMIPISKSVVIESEVNISAEDITNALQESVCNANEAEHVSALRVFIGEVYQCLRAVDDRMVLKIPDKHRQIIAKALRDQAARYWSDEATS